MYVFFFLKERKEKKIKYIEFSINTRLKRYKDPVTWDSMI